MPTPAPTLYLDRAHGRLHDGAGLAFNADALAWGTTAQALAGNALDPVAAVRWLQKESGAPSRQPIGVIGGHHATHAQLAAARLLGNELAKIGLTVLCGGRRGVMLAVCEGVAAQGGVSIGLLPGESIADGNPFVTVPIPTGVGLARNAIIARGALASSPSAAATARCPKSRSACSSASACLASRARRTSTASSTCRRSKPQ